MQASVLKAWIQAARPKTLWAAVAPVLLGTAIARAEGLEHLPAALAVLAAAICIQVGTNLANDYFDHFKGADTAERLGPVRATQAGLIAPGATRRAFIAAFALALLIGVYLLWRGGWPILLIGLSSLLLGVVYTGGPWSLAYLGLADFFAFAWFGPIAVAGTYYVQALKLSGLSLAAGLAPGLFSLALLTVNNHRDRAADIRAGKRSPAVRFGAAFSRGEYLCCVAGAALLPVSLMLWGGLPPWSLLAGASCALLWPAARDILRVSPEALDFGARMNAALGATGRQNMVYSLLLSLAILSGG